jgi:hypothetical protein
MLQESDMSMEESPVLRKHHHIVNALKGHKNGQNFDNYKQFLGFILQCFQ